MNEPPDAWGAPPSVLLPPYDAVHVWSMWLEQPAAQVQRLAQRLSPEERARAARFHFERDRAHFTVGRALLRTLLGRYLEVPPERLGFDYGPHGKPSLAHPFNEGGALRFNLSHSRGLALLALTWQRELGVDVEEVRTLEHAEQIASRFFSPSEAATFRGVPASGKPQAFFNCWTRKEAYLKACGDGLMRPLDEFDVTLLPGDAPRLLRVAHAPAETTRWSLAALHPSPGYVGALCVEGEGWALSCWQWPGEEPRRGG